MHYQSRNRGTTVRLSAAMAPMIDVVFLLLIFFLVNASLQPPEEELAARLVVDQPPTVASQQTDQPQSEAANQTVVELKGKLVATGTRWRIATGRWLTVDELRTSLPQLVADSQASRLRIDPEAEVPLGDVVQVYDLARLAGFEESELVADWQE